MMKRRLFGTDGIRAEANVYPMTGEVAMRVGRALVYSLLREREAWRSGFADPFRKKGEASKIRIVIGKDTRRSGYMIEQALASGVCAMGGEAILLGPLPTPGVAFVAQSMRADAGVMISASHNPFHDNGIKIFGPDGFKAPDAVEAVIEDLVSDPTRMDAELPRGAEIGRAYRIEEAHGRYIVFLKSKFPDHADLSGVRIALDCANGAAYKAAPMAFEELGAVLNTIGVAPNGTNINHEIGALHPEKMAELTRRTKSQIGIALDGDADRVILSDENGEILDGDVVIGLCALAMQERGELRQNAIVTTPMSNIGLELALKEKGITMHRANVGDRFVVEKMRAEGINLGGEQSGHIIFLDSSTTGDGALAALKVLEIMQSTGKPLSELKQAVRLFPQTLLNLKVRERKDLEELDSYQKTLKKCRDGLKKGRIFVRYSGTEPKLRILVESESSLTNERIANQLKESLIEDLGQ